MRQVPPPTIDDTELFDDIAAAKHGKRRAHLQAARANILAAYASYVAAAPDVAALPTCILTEPQRKALLHAFEVETAPMIKARGDLLERISAAQCPFCALSESSTLDHYLPKEQNPQFSVYAKNLIPCCPTCNTKKRDRVLVQRTNVRLFLHPYYDVVPNVRFLVVRAALRRTAISLAFRVMRPSGMTYAKYLHIKSHFSTLNLANRYRLMSLAHLRDLYRPLARFYGDDENPSRVRDNLLQRASDFEADYGLNDWRAVLYRSLAAIDEFCDGGFAVLRIIQ